MRRWMTPAVVLCAVSLMPTVSTYAADPVQPFKPCSGAHSKNDDEAAKGLFEAGKASYNEADYTRAIQYWRDAYDRDCTAVLILLNLANAYEKSGNVDGAIASLEAYLKRKPNADDAPTIQRRVDNLKRYRSASNSGPGPAVTPAASASTPPSEPLASPAAASSSTATADAPTSAFSSSEKTPEGKGLVLAPWIVAGVGGALAITGVVLLASGSSKVSDAESKCGSNHVCPSTVPDRQSVIDQGNTGRSQRSAGGLLMGFGLAGVAGGVIWGVLANGKGHHDSGKDAAFFAAPALGNGVTGFQAGGQF